VEKTCYHSVQGLLSSCLLPKNVWIQVYKSVILPVVLYGCEIFLTSRKKHTLRVSEKRVLRISGLMKDEIIV
jgi:hypothetical protein